MSSFTDEQVMRPEAQELIPKIEMKRHQGYEGQTSWTEAYHEVEIHLNDGRVLTQRADLPDHGGQVSLPGGEVESDEAMIDAALREAHEEVSIEPQLVSVLGRLTPIHIPVSNFVLHPIVGTTRERPNLRADDREVARILEPQIVELADPARHGIRSGTHAESLPLIPYFRVEDLEVWGATAMVLAE